MNYLHQHIEALIFASERRITAAEITSCLNLVFNQEYETAEIAAQITLLMEKYQKDEFFFELARIDNGYQFLTKNKFAGSLSILFQQNNKKKLSNAAMETLSIIAYQQPITKVSVEQIRGVNCDYSIQKLLEKDLISIAGKSDAPGRPILYTTSKLFMDYFKLDSIEDLPVLKDIQPEENEIGVQAES